MAGRHNPQTHLKRQRERTKQEKRIEKLARRKERNDLKRAAKESGTPLLPTPPLQAEAGAVERSDVGRDRPAQP